MPVRNDFAPGEFCWVDLTAHDLEAAIQWYGELFGWTAMRMEMPDAPPYAFFMKGEAVVGGIGQMSDEMKAQGIPPVWNNYVATADCNAMEAKVAECGGTVTVPTMEVPGNGKLAFFLDPEGASFAAWQSTNPSPPKMLVSEPGGVCWTELMTRDVSKASEFYGKLLGWSFESIPMGDADYSLIKNAGEGAAGAMVMDGPKFEGIPAYWLTYFTVENCAASASKAQDSGGRVCVPPTKIPVGEFSVLSEPQGGVFAVITLAARS